MPGKYCISFEEIELSQWWKKDEDWHADTGGWRSIVAQPCANGSWRKEDTAGWRK